MPSAAAHGGATLDPATGRAVLLAGLNAQTQLWEFDGTDWHARAVPGVAPQYSGHLTYDSTRGRFVCYTHTGETWEFDGAAWSLRVSVSPPGVGYGLVFDGSRSLLLAEQAGQYVLWGWNGSAWSLVAPAGPVRTSSPPAMAYDPIRAEVLLFGGGTVDLYTARPIALDVMSRWNGTAWSTIPVAANWPAARSQAAFAFDPRRGVMVLHGGVGGFFGFTDVASVSEWNGASWSPAQPAPGVHGHTLVWNQANTALLAICGSGQVHAWDGSLWQNLAPQGSPGLRSVVDTGTGLRSVNLVSAAQPSVTGWLDHAWRALDVAPPPFLGGDVAFDGGRGVIVALSHATGSTAEWSQATGWVTGLSAISPARSGAAMTYDPVRQRVVLFGGNAYQAGDLADTWDYDGTSWTQLALQASPPAASLAQMAFDPVTQRVMLVSSGTNAFLLQPGTWSPVPAPAAGSSGLLGLDRANNRITFFDQNTGALARWNGTTWSAAGAASIAAFTTNLASDPIDGLLLFTPEDPSPAARVGVAAVPAVVAALGTGCGTPTPPSLVADRPWLGDPSFLLEARGIGAGGLCVFGIAANSAAVPLGTCTLLLGGTPQLVDRIANSSGIASVTFTIPRTASLRGAVAYAQAGTFGPAGFALTGGLRLTVGD